MKEQEYYREFCTERGDIPLFMLPYWLDVVCGPDQWDAVLHRDAEGRITGAWAYHFGTKAGMRWIRLPAITPFTGIWLDIPEDGPVQKQIADRQEILSALAAQLPRVQIFELKVHWSLHDWLPLYWQGYRQETRYTFRFDMIDTKGIHAQFSKSFRRNLRAAERHYTITDCTASELYPLMEHVFGIRDAQMPLSSGTLEQVIAMLSARGQCRLYGARDSDGLQAAILTVWDAGTTYYLIGGRRRTDSRHGINLLLWQAIRDAAARGHAFDFEGSMIEGVNRFFQSFGARLTPYCYFYRYRGIARLKYLQ